MRALPSPEPMSNVICQITVDPVTARGGGSGRT
jgi:hypothetical protein